MESEWKDGWMDGQWADGFVKGWGRKEYGGMEGWVDG